MKSADTSTKTSLTGFRTAGASPLITFRCARCNLPKGLMGRKKTRSGYACGACVALAK